MFKSLKTKKSSFNDYKLVKMLENVKFQDLEEFYQNNIDVILTEVQAIVDKSLEKGYAYYDVNTKRYSDKMKLVINEGMMDLGYNVVPSYGNYNKYSLINKNEEELNE